MTITYGDAGVVVPRFKAGDLVVGPAKHGNVSRTWRLLNTPLLLSTRYRNLARVESVSDGKVGVVDLNRCSRGS
jgi:hypothetical protein